MNRYLPATALWFIAAASTAFVERARAGEPVVPGTGEFLKACCGLDPASGTPFDSSGFLGYVMRAGTEARFLEFSKQADPAVFAALQQALLSSDLQLNVCYCSIFDQCWQSDLVTLSLKPKQVEACTLPKVSFDMGISNGKR